MLIRYVLYFALSHTLLASSPEEQLRQYYLPEFQDIFILKQKAQLIQLEHSRVSFIKPAWSDFIHQDDAHQKNLSNFKIREYLVKSWAQHFQPSPILQNPDLPQHLQISSYKTIFPTQTRLAEVYGAYLMASGSTADEELLQKRQNWIRSYQDFNTQETTLVAAQKIQSCEQDLIELIQSLPASQTENLSVLEKSTPLILNPVSAEWLLLKHPMKLPTSVIPQYANLIFVPASWIATQSAMGGFLNFRGGPYGLVPLIRGLSWRVFSLTLASMTLLETGTSTYKIYTHYIHKQELNLKNTRQLKALGVFLKNLSHISAINSENELIPKTDSPTHAFLEDILASIEDLDASPEDWVYHSNLIRTQILFTKLAPYKSTLEKLLLEFARLEFYASVAQQKLNFANFIHSSEPYLKADKLWHPLLGPNSIPNNISLKQGYLLLTGPNASGKSTLMRAVGINILHLAQTLGVATAESFSIAPFTSFYAFMETQDKTGESSSYQTELNRLVKAIKAQNYTRGFLLADELFSSTNSHDALIGSHEILNTLHPYPQSSGIISTHLFKLSENNFIQNFHMDQYHLFPHASTEHRALEIFEKEMQKPISSKPHHASENFEQNDFNSLAFQILSPHIPQLTDVDIQSNIWNDLEIDSLNLLNYQTLLGQIYGNLFLKRSITSNLKILEIRQSNIRDLRKNPELLKTIRFLLNSFHNFEKNLIDTYNQKSWVNHYELLSKYQTDEELQFLATGIFTNENSNPGHILWNTIINTYLSFPAALITEYKMAQWVFSGRATLYSKSLFGLSSFLTLMNILRNPLSSHQELMEISEKLDLKMQDLLQSSLIFFQLLALNETLPENLNFQISQEELDLLLTFIHRVKASPEQIRFPFNLANFRLFMELRRTLAKQLVQIARLDLYSSLAISPWPLAQYSIESGSLVQGKKVINPLLDPKIAIPNDVNLGEAVQTRQVLLTGPNASGKSTWMRAVALNIYLAQTFGIVTAEQFSLSPFNILNSFMKHSDATGEESSYQREVRNMHNIIALYQSLKPTDRAFLILDEVLRSTNPEEAEAASKQILENLSQYPQGLMMVATHLRNLSNLFSLNQHLENYQIYEGVSYDSSALQFLKEKLKGIESLTRESTQL